MKGKRKRGAKRLGLAQNFAIVLIGRSMIFSKWVAPCISLSRNSLKRNVIPNLVDFIGKAKKRLKRSSMSL